MPKLGDEKLESKFHLAHRNEMESEIAFNLWEGRYEIHY